MKKLAFFLLSLLLPFAIQAQNNTRYTGSLLWKVSGKDLTKASYLLGTNHLIEKEFLYTISGFQKAFDEADVIVGEILMDDMPAMQQLLMSRAMMPEEGDNYRSLMSEEEYNELDQALLTIFGMPLQGEIEKVKPAFVDVMISIRMYADLFPDRNFAEHVSMDACVQNLAEEKGKEVVGLETGEDQVASLIDNEPIANQITSLLCLVRNMEALRIETSASLDSYKKGNLSQLYAEAIEDEIAVCPISEKAKIALCDVRNNNWLKQLPAMMRSKSNLVVVGALHLAGDEGILNQLAKMGYEVEAVK